MAQDVSPKDLVRGVFAALDAKDPVAITARMPDDVRMRLGNAAFVEGKAKFREASGLPRHRAGVRVMRADSVARSRRG